MITKSVIIPVVSGLYRPTGLLYWKCPNVGLLYQLQYISAQLDGMLWLPMYELNITLHTCVVMCNFMMYTAGTVWPYWSVRVTFI